MTREEAIKKLEHYRYCLNFQYGWYSKDDDEVFDMAIKTLEQQPTDAVDRVTIKEYLESYNVVKTELSGDAVDRRAVYEIINDAYYLKLDDGAALQESVRQLPSVTAQQKMGKWIYKKEEDSYRCSLCTFPCHKDNMGAIPTKYCAGCGAYMQEVEE